MLECYEWLFSRIVENLDSIFIPYFDTQAQVVRKFYPDFVFWLRHKQSGAYKIIFVDPKGLSHEHNARDKLRGFQELFTKKQSFEGLGEIDVRLFYYNKNSSIPEEFAAMTKARVGEMFLALV